MNLNKLPFNWFDIAVVIVLFIGVQRGRKRGMSEEWLSMFQWAAVVLVCAIAYEPMGQWLTTVSPFSPLFSYILCYILAGIAVTTAFILLKATLGKKTVGSDAFGSAEYYLGMPSGMVRFACILLAGLALLNARQYRTEEIKAMAKFQNDNYGSQFFPTLQTVQEQVFEKSFTGPPIKKYLSFLLIKPTRPEGKPLQRAQEKKFP